MKPRDIITAAIFLFSGFDFHAAAQTTDVLTYHNDNGRTGQMLQEPILRHANVNSAHFGLLRVLPVDGKVDAQPLYAAGVPIPSKGFRNTVFVATEHDSVYCFDADTGELLWQASMLPAGETPSDDRGCTQVTPEIGITATPVIDRRLGPNGTMFVTAMSKTIAGGEYIQRVHALDIVTGTDTVPATEVVGVYPGTGDNSSGGNVFFDPAQYKERQGLLLLNGIVYIAWSSHCDTRPYTGWIMGYDERTLAQKIVFNLTPNGNEGAVWMSGAGMAADAAGNIYMLVGNGTFDTTLDSKGFPIQQDFGNSFLKLSLSGTTLTPSDYFATYNTPYENAHDLDLGSGGALVAPDLVTTSGIIRHLAIGAGKDASLFVVNRDNMGKFHATNDNSIYQELPKALPGGVWGMPAYFNRTIYYGSEGAPIQAFSFHNARLSSSASSRTSKYYYYPGATPSISASGTSNGILWATANDNPAVLYAYDATNLATELYDSNQAAGGRDQFGAGNKFITPTIASARVYVGTTNGVAVFGLLDQTTLTRLQRWRDNHFRNPSNAGAGADTFSAASDGVPNLVKYALGLDPKAVAAESQLPLAGDTRIGVNDYLTLTVNRAAALADVTYVVEVSGDLVKWSSGAGNTTTITNSARQLVVRDSTPRDGARARFIRLRVTVP